jgi:N-acyl homoserine lactone hydrolase
MKVYILDNGWLECDQNWMVAMSVVGRNDNKTPPVSWIRIPVYMVLIDHPSGKILYDTGCHPGAMEGHWPKNLQSIFPYHCTQEHSLENSLAQADTGLDDIRTVVLSHLHCDHAGNLHRFAHADVYVPKNDFEHARILVRDTDNPEAHGAYVKADVNAPAKRFHLVEEDLEIAEGVRLVNLPGHTPGLLGLLVQLKQDGALLFPQDAVYTRANFGPPARFSGIVYDSIAFLKSIEKVRALAAQYQAKVMFSHDMEFFKTLKTAPRYYC